MKSALGTVIGWIIVALLVFWGFGFILGTLRFLLRSVFMFLLLGGLVFAYFALKDPPKVE
jgi:Ca2+/Na+ antiporter